MLSTFFSRNPGALNDELNLSQIPLPLTREEGGRRRRILQEFVGDLETSEQFARSPLWEKVVSCESVDPQAFHDSVIYREVVVARLRRMLPLMGILNQDDETLGTEWFAVETGSYDIDCETAHVASDLARGILQLGERNIIKVDFLNEGYI